MQAIPLHFWTKLTQTVEGFDFFFLIAFKWGYITDVRHHWSMLTVSSFSSFIFFKILVSFKFSVGYGFLKFMLCISIWSQWKKMCSSSYCSVLGWLFHLFVLWFTHACINHSHVSCSQLFQHQIYGSSSFATHAYVPNIKKDVLDANVHGLVCVCNTCPYTSGSTIVVFFSSCCNLLLPN